MFKIEKIIMEDYDGNTYEYKFDYGINYYKGKNSSGKTEFYKFIDYMLGASFKIENNYWYKGTLKEAIMEISYNDISFMLKRILGEDKNYFYYKDELIGESISLGEYKDKLNALFMRNEEELKNIREFVEENLTYRAFTMFNFLGEKRQGCLNDFLDKCSDISYSVKLNPILNFIFNKNLSEIAQLKQELAILLEEVKGAERKINRRDFVYNKINTNLRKLNIPKIYTGRNQKEIKEAIDNLKSFRTTQNQEKSKTIAELEVIYNNIDEQIKVYENRIKDSKKMNVESINRKILLERLEKILDSAQYLDYLITPVETLVKQLDNSIAFSKYIINDNTINEMKQQRDKLKKEILKNDYRFRIFNADEKTKAVSVIEDYLDENIFVDEDDLKEKYKRIKQIKEMLKVLQSADDNSKIEQLSTSVTTLYSSAYKVSELVKHDVDIEGFKIQYFKRGNILQPLITVEEEQEEEKIKRKTSEKYYTGSMARHTLMQLCGYLAFLELMIKEDKYPLAPILVIDHISKPFDEVNRKAIGVILEEFYRRIDKTQIQIFMFDDEDFGDLSIKEANVNELYEDGKSGFNPFYYEEK